jgi:hypothetical protein
LDAAGNRHLIAKDTLVRAAGVGQENGDDKGALAGCWSARSGDPAKRGCWMLVRGVDWVHWPYRFFNPKSAFRNQKSRSWMIDAGCWSARRGDPAKRECCLLVSGHLSLFAGIVNLEFYWIAPGFSLYSFFYHYSVALIFSMGFFSGKAFLTTKPPRLNKKKCLKRQAKIGGLVGDLPHGGRRLPVRGYRRHAMVSIHAPAWGATPLQGRAKGKLVQIQWLAFP